MRVHLSGCQVFPEFEAIHFPSPRSRQQHPQSPPPRSGQIPREANGCASEEPVVAPPSSPLPPTLPALEHGVEEGGLLGQWWGERSAEWTCHEVYVHTHARKYARTHARRRHRRTDGRTHTHTHAHTHRRWCEKLGRGGCSYCQRLKTGALPCAALRSCHAPGSEIVIYVLRMRMQVIAHHDALHDLLSDSLCLSSPPLSIPAILPLSLPPPSLSLSLSPLSGAGGGVACAGGDDEQGHSSSARGNQPAPEQEDEAPQCTYRSVACKQSST